MCVANLKLNPEQCVFGVTRGKVLGCLVSTKGIEASRNKIREITKMQPPQTRKEVQKLTGRIAALNRFIMKLAEKSLPFFSIMRGSTKVDWGAEQQQVFDDVKHYLKHLPTLSSPEQGQPLILYVSATLCGYWSLGCREGNQAQSQHSEAAIPDVHVGGPHGIREVLF
jgi:hypothetical protein